MSDKNFKVKNGLDAVGPITISPSSNSIDGIVINTQVGGKAIRFIRVGTGEVASIDEWGTYSSNGINIVQPWYVRNPGIESQSFFWVASGARSAAGFAGTNSGTNPVIYISQNGSAANDLTQWIKSDNTVLAKVDYLGNITANDLTLAGNLTVNGTTTNLNSTNLIIEDKNIIIADVATPTNTTADGAGITIKGATDKTFNWVQSTGRFTSSEPIQSSAFVSTYVYASQIGSTVIGTATLNTNSDTGGVLINTAGVANKGLIVRGAASQTADLQQWQNSDGTVLTRVDSAGELTATQLKSSGDIRIQSGSNLFESSNTGPYLNFGSSALTVNHRGVTTTTSFIVKGMASQTANLQEWQNSAGTILPSIGPNGTMTLKSVNSANIATFYNGTNGYGAGGITYNGLFNINGANMGFPYTSTGATLNVNAGASNIIPLTVKGVASQTADLQQWQNSAGTVLAKIDSSGNWQNSIQTNTTLYTQSVNSGSLSFAGVSYNGISNPTGVTTLPTLVVKAIGSQSADLQQWQNSAGTVLAKVTAAGDINIDISQGGSFHAQASGGQVGDYNLIKMSQTSTQKTTLLTTVVSGGNTEFSVKTLIGSLTTTLKIDKDSLVGIGKNNTSPLAQIDVRPQSASTIGAIIRGAESQSVNLTEWQGSGGNSTTVIDPYGAVYVSDTVMVGPKTSWAGDRFATGGLTIVNRGGASAIPFGVRGAVSQTADLTQWQDSAGSVLAKVNTNGVFHTFGSVYTPYIQPASPTGVNAFIALDNTTVLIDGWSASTVKLTVKGYTSQSANLQEWKNSAGTVLTSISSTGKLTSAVDASINGVAFGLGSSGSASRNIAIGLAAGESFGGNDQNLAIGYSAGRYNYGANNVLIGDGAGIYNGGGGGSNNTYLGVQAGYSGAGASNVMIGYQAGINTAGNNKLVISNSSTATPLIGGDFSAKTLTIAGNASIISQATGTVGLIVKAIASQTANLQQWQNSDGGVLAYVSNDGTFQNTGDINSGSTIRLGSGASSAGGYPVFAIKNATVAPTSNPTNGGVIYVESGSLKYRGQGGAITTIAASTLDDQEDIENSEVQLIQYGAEGSVLQNLPTRIHPAEQLLKESVLWLDPAHSSAGSQTIQNLGWGGTALNATAGANTSVSTDEPKYLSWEGENYIYATGETGNFMMSSASTSLGMTTSSDLDMRVKVSLDVLSGRDQMLMSTWWYRLHLTSSGYVGLSWNDNTTFNNIYSSNLLSSAATVGQEIWIRGTLKLNNGSGVSEVKFYTSKDGTTWTQLGSTYNGASTSILGAGGRSLSVEVGSLDGGVAGVSSGKIYRAQVLQGVDGVVVFDCDTSLVSSGSSTTFNALTGHIMTITRNTVGRKMVAVTHPLWLFGTDDYLKIADNNLLDFTTNQPFTIFLSVREFASTGGNKILLGKGIYGGWQGYTITSGDSLTQLYFSGPQANISYYYSANLGKSTTSRNYFYGRSATNTFSYLNNNLIGGAEEVSPQFDTSNAYNLYLGRAENGQYSNMELFGVAIWRRALTAAEIATVSRYYEGRAI